MGRTAIYVRQSADRADSVSLETQEQLCRTELSAEEEAVVYADRGYSGKNTQRPGLRAMMEHVERGEISRVLVYKLDRISRNLADFTDLLQVFSRQGVAFSSHTERFETASPMGQAMQSLLMVFAQLERETISGRVRDAAFARAKIGFDTGGPPPIGFRREPFLLMGKHTHMLVPDVHADQIQQLFATYGAANSGLGEIAKQWNSKGCCTMRGNAWSAATLARILRNPVYAMADSSVYAHLASLGATLCVPETILEGHGVYLYADRRINHVKFTDLHGVYAITAPHMGLIAPALWLACQHKLNARKSARTLGAGERTWLSGSIFCMRCGSAMTAVQGRNAVYLVCSGKKRGICGGAGATWRCAEAEWLAEQVLIMRMQEIAEDGCTGENARNTALQREKASLELRRARLMQSLTESDDVQIGVIAEAVAQLDCRLAALEQQQKNVVSRRTLSVPRWETLTFGQKKTIAKQLLCCAMVDGDTLHCYLQ